MMAETENDLGNLADDPRWRMPRLRAGSAVWTDDFSDLASYIRWLPRIPVLRPDAATPHPAGIDR